MYFLTTGGEGLIGKVLIKKLKYLGYNHLIDFDKINGEYNLFEYKKNLISFFI